MILINKKTNSKDLMIQTPGKRFGTQCPGKTESSFRVQWENKETIVQVWGEVCLTVERWPTGQIQQNKIIGKYF